MRGSSFYKSSNRRNLKQESFRQSLHTTHIDESITHFWHALDGNNVIGEESLFNGFGLNVEPAYAMDINGTIRDVINF